MISNQSYEEAFFCVGENNTEKGIDRGKFEFALQVMAHNIPWQSRDIEDIYAELEKLWVEFANSVYYQLDQSFLQSIHDFCQSKFT